MSFTDALLCKLYVKFCLLNVHYKNKVYVHGNDAALFSTFLSDRDYNEEVWRYHVMGHQLQEIRVTKWEKNTSWNWYSQKIHVSLFKIQKFEVQIKGKVEPFLSPPTKKRLLRGC